MEQVLYQLGIDPASAAGITLVLVAVIWAAAALLIPITLLGLYQLSVRQNRLLREISASLRAIEESVRASRKDPAI